MCESTRSNGSQSMPEKQMFWAVCRADCPGRPTTFLLSQVSQLCRRKTVNLIILLSKEIRTIVGTVRTGSQSIVRRDI